jgi:hypothetical protein
MKWNELNDIKNYFNFRLIYYSWGYFIIILVIKLMNRMENYVKKYESGQVL